MRHAGLLQDYNYLTTGFDKYFLDLLEINGHDLEKRVLEGGTDEELSTWVAQQGKRTHGRGTRTMEGYGVKQWLEKRRGSTTVSSTPS